MQSVQGLGRVAAQAGQHAGTGALPLPATPRSFTTHTGTVSAASDWDTPVQRMAVRKAMPGSYGALRLHPWPHAACGLSLAAAHLARLVCCHPRLAPALCPCPAEYLFHKTGLGDFALDLRGGSADLRAALQGVQLSQRQRMHAPRPVSAGHGAGPVHPAPLKRRPAPALHAHLQARCWSVPLE